MRLVPLLLLFLYLAIPNSTAQTQNKSFGYEDLFDLQYASDPQISPDGNWVVYRRMGFDIMKDKSRGNLWMVSKDGSQHQKLTSGEGNESSPRWSPDGKRIAYTASSGEGNEIYMYWVSTGKTARITQLPFSPSSLSWSPDGESLMESGEG